MKDKKERSKTTKKPSLTEDRLLKIIYVLNTGHQPTKEQISQMEDEIKDIK